MILIKRNKNTINVKVHGDSNDCFLELQYFLKYLPNIIKDISTEPKK